MPPKAPIKLTQEQIDMIALERASKVVHVKEEPTAPTPDIEVSNLTDAAQVQQQLEGVNLAGLDRDTRSAIMMSTALGVMNNRTARTYTVTKPESIRQTANIGHFELNLTRINVPVETVLGETFKNHPFEHEMERTLVKKELLHKAYKAFKEMKTAANANAVDLQLARIDEALDEINVPMGVKSLIDDIMSKQKIEQVQAPFTSHAKSKAHVVPPPLLNLAKGIDSPDSKTLDQALKIVGNHTYNGKDPSRTIESHLRKLEPIIRFRFNRRGAYELLFHTFSGLPLKMIEIDYRAGKPFEKAWKHLLDLCTRNTDRASAAKRIQQLMTTRPDNLLEVLLELKVQVSQKNDQIKSEKVRLDRDNEDLKEAAMTILELWYPTYFPQIQGKFIESENLAHMNGDKNFDPYDVIVDLISQNMGASATPIYAPSPKSSKVSALELPGYYGEQQQFFPIPDIQIQAMNLGGPRPNYAQPNLGQMRPNMGPIRPSGGQPQQGYFHGQQPQRFPNAQYHHGQPQRFLPPGPGPRMAGQYPPQQPTGSLVAQAGSYYPSNLDPQGQRPSQYSFGNNLPLYTRGKCALCLDNGHISKNCTYYGNMWPNLSAGACAYCMGFHLPKRCRNLDPPQAPKTPEHPTGSKDQPDSKSQQQPQAEQRPKPNFVSGPQLAPVEVAHGEGQVNPHYYQEQAQGYYNPTTMYPDLSFDQYGQPFHPQYQ